MSNEMVRYQLDNGQDIQVTESDVRDLLAASGHASNNVTGQEIKTFMRLCQAQRLNPFTRDAYIVKYGNSPATIITGKETFTKRATRNKRFRGMEAGITVVALDGAVMRREGSMLIAGEKLLGGWCRVYIEGYEKPMFDEVSMAEYSTGKSNWTRIPATMIRKVAITHALREAFPEDLGGLYGEEEMQSSSSPQVTAPEGTAEIIDISPEAPAAVQPSYNGQDRISDHTAKANEDRPAGADRLSPLRDLMRKAKSVGLIVSDPADPSVGLMGHVYDEYGCEVEGLSDAQLEAVEAYVRGRIAEMDAPGDAEAAIEEPRLLGADIEF